MVNPVTPGENIIPYISDPITAYLQFFFHVSAVTIPNLLRPTINTGISKDRPNAIVYMNIKETKLDIPMVTWAPTPISNLVNILKRIGAMKYMPTKATQNTNKDQINYMKIAEDLNIDIKDKTIDQIIGEINAKLGKSTTREATENVAELKQN